MKLGIVGNGGIVQTVLPAIQNCGIETPALWCRNAQKGKAIIEKFGITTYFDDYKEFLKADSFDTVYIGLVNSLHYSYAKQALAAGKNVILEKPFCSTWAEAQDLLQAAKENGVYAVEAMLPFFNANADQIAEHLEEIGDLRIVTSVFAKYSSRYDAYRKGTVLPAFDPQLSGGALYDINVYNIALMVCLFGKPRYSYYLANLGENGMDTSGVLAMNYGGFKAVCIGTKDSTSPSGVTLTGTDGVITVESYPSLVRKISVTNRVTGESKRIDADLPENPYEMEFSAIRKAMEQKDDVQIYIWNQWTLEVMNLLMQARQDAGIVFPADEEVFSVSDEEW